MCSNLYHHINEVTHGQADKLFRYFNVGTSKSGNTVYWMVNVEGKICQPKIIIYKPDGHRDKSKPPIAAIGYTMDSGFRPCLFGEQYLKSGKTVMIVESEKTCILSHYIFPEYTWIASGGKNGLSSEKINVLEGHKVVIIPDADEDGRKSASVAKERLKKKGIACTVKDLLCSDLQNAKCKTIGVLQFALSLIWSHAHK